MRAHRLSSLSGLPGRQLPASTSGRIASQPRLPPSSAPRHRSRHLGLRAEPPKDGGAGGAGGAGGEEPVDIDALARRLSQEANKLRKSMESMDEGLNEEGMPFESRPKSRPVGPSAPSEIGGAEPPMMDFSRLDGLGPKRIGPEDLELYQVIGRLAYRREYAVEDGSRSPMGRRRETEGPERTAVIAYLGQYISGRPFEGPVTVLIKEYVQGCRNVAANELRVMAALLGPIPENTWQTAVAEGPDLPPVIRPLGFFVGEGSEDAQEITNIDEQILGLPPMNNGPVPDSLWVVYQYTGTRPASIYPSFKQTEPFRWLGGAEKAAKLRLMYLQSLTAGCLLALAFCHERGVIHGSVGSGTIFLSTLEDKEAAALVVRLDSFGFGRALQAGPGSGALSPEGVPAAAGLSTDDNPLALALLEDRKALAAALVELYGAALWPGAGSSGDMAAAMAAAAALDPSSAPPGPEEVRRVLLDVHRCRIDEFAAYCESDPRYEGVSRLLAADGGAGWEMMRSLLDVSIPLRFLAENSPFLQAAMEARRKATRKGFFQ